MTDIVKVGDQSLNVVATQYKALGGDLDKFKLTLAANAGHGQLKVSDLDQIRIPTGGGTTWRIPDLIQGEVSAKEIEGVVVYWAEPRGYWSVGFEQSGGGSPPDCSSTDGITGIGNPGGDCATCALNMWGSGKNAKGEPTRGKACREQRMLYLLTPTKRLPFAVQLPPTSVAPLRKFFLRMSSEGLPYWSAVVKIGLDQTKSNQGITYSILRPMMVRALSDIEEQTVTAYATALRPMLEASAYESLRRQGEQDR